MGKGILWSVGIAAIAIIAGVLGTYAIKFSNYAWGGPADWGMFGDYVGGLANPLLSFLTIFLLIVSLYYQNQELAATREELSQSRKAMQQANQIHDNNVLLQSRNNLRHQIERHFKGLMKEFMELADMEIDFHAGKSWGVLTINRYIELISSRESSLSDSDMLIIESNQEWMGEGWNGAAAHQICIFNKTTDTIASLIEFSDSELLLMPALEQFNEAKDLMIFSRIFEPSDMDPIEARLDEAMKKRLEMKFPKFHKIPSKYSI